MHPLLRRQMRKLRLDAEAAPGLAEWRAFLERVGRTYEEADRDRYTMERSLGISSREMGDLYRAQEAARQKLEGWAQELERRVAERSAALEEAQGRLVISERLAAVGQLAAGTAHEINNPLAYVLANLEYAYGELAARSETDSDPIFAEMRDALREALQGTERIRNTTRDLMLFSRGGTVLPGPVELVRVLQSSINMASTEIRHRAVVVRDLQDVPAVEGDESRLGQVFLNLLLNAAQAIPEGAVDRNQIRVRACRAGARVAVEISDTGVGIPRENLSRLFEPFFTTKPPGQGTGLGLSICHGIVKSLGGTIEVESEVGQGTLVRVLLPAAAGGRARDEAYEAAAARRRARVMVVDDEPLILLAFQRILGAHHDVRGFPGGRQALEAVRAGEQPEVILCDLMMPGLSGIELHAALPPDLARRIIFVTGGAFTPRARAFLDEADNPVVHKPFDAQSLLAAIEAMLEQPPPELSSAG